MVRAEGKALLKVADQLGDSFVASVALVSQCTGRVLTSGAGTSGTVARRLSHLLSACGIPAFFVHPSDALHGASAGVTAEDVIIAFSKAGQSAELNQFVRIARERGAKVVSLTWEPESELARSSDVVVTVRPDSKGEGEGVLPFGSSVANASVGDALCLIARRLRGIRLGELARTHPSGGIVELIQKSDKL